MHIDIAEYPTNSYNVYITCIFDIIIIITIYFYGMRSNEHGMPIFQNKSSTFPSTVCQNNDNARRLWLRNANLRGKIMVYSPFFISKTLCKYLLFIFSRKTNISCYRNSGVNDCFPLLKTINNKESAWVRWGITINTNTQFIYIIHLPNTFIRFVLCMGFANANAVWCIVVEQPNAAHPELDSDLFRTHKSYIPGAAPHLLILIFYMAHDNAISIYLFWFERLATNVGNCVRLTAVHSTVQSSQGTLDRFLSAILTVAFGKMEKEERARKTNVRSYRVSYI